MTKLFVKTEPECFPDYEGAIRQMQEVTLAGGLSDCDGVVTHDGATALEGARLGRPVLLGPPFNDRFLDVAEVCRQKAVCFLPAHHWRFTPEVEVIRQRLRSGQLGRPALLRIHDWNPGHAGTGGWADWVLPALDLGRWLLGSLPERIYAVWRGVGDGGYRQIHAGYAGGGMMVSDHQMALPGPNSYQSLSLIGSQGAAHADDHANAHLLMAREGWQHSAPERGEMAVHGLLREFVSCLVQGGEPLVGIEDTLSLVKMARAAHASAEAGRVARRNGEEYVCD